MKLTTRGRYASQALIDLTMNANGKAVKLFDISSRQNLSIAYLEQLFRQLRIGGVVKSVRGPGGGYVLAKEPSQITMRDILKSVGEDLDFADCLEVPKDDSSEAFRKVYNMILTLDEANVWFLNKTLESLL